MNAKDFCEQLRTSLELYHREQRWDMRSQVHRDPFIQWFRDVGEPRLDRRVLLILVNARFDQGTVAENALHNTKAVLVSGVVYRQGVSVDEIPPLKTRQRVSAARWRNLFHVALPDLQALSITIASQRDWRASDLLSLITTHKVPFFGPKTARLAVRWIHELVPELTIDMSDSEVPVDSLVYRVCSRMGIIDPALDKYTGPGSVGHRKIQQFARTLFPHNPSLMDEPLWMMARKRRNGGFCYPTDPACDAGCIFRSICPRLWTDSDPVALGYHLLQNTADSGRRTDRCHIAGPDFREASLSVPEREAGGSQDASARGLLVVISCVKNKIWDVDPTAPPAVAVDNAYVGSYFSKNRLYGRRFGEQWCVLSAKFGVA